MPLLSPIALSAKIFFFNSIHEHACVLYWHQTRCRRTNQRHSLYVSKLIFVISVTMGLLLLVRLSDQTILVGKMSQRRNWAHRWRAPSSCYLCEKPEKRDTSLRLPYGDQGVVVSVRILNREDGDELDAGVIKQISQSSPTQKLLLVTKSPVVTETKELLVK